MEPKSPTLQADSLPAEPQGKPENTEVDSLSLLQRIFPTQESKQGLLHCRQILYQLAELPGKPNIATESFKSCCKAINSNFPSLYAGQEATVRTGHGTTDWFQIGKEALAFNTEVQYFLDLKLCFVKLQKQIQIPLCKYIATPGPF